MILNPASPTLPVRTILFGWTSFVGGVGQDIMKKVSGIYKIQSKIKPDRIYVGSSSNLSHRRTVHYHELALAKHKNGRLQNHYNKYGADDLTFLIIEECSIDVLIEREQHYIDTLSPWFNICKKAGNILGVKRSKETRLKMRLSLMGNTRNLGRSFSEEHKQKISKSNLGKKHTPESIEKIKLSKSYISPETRKKMSDAKIGNVPWNKGKTKFTDPILADIGRRRIGFKMTDEQKNKISISKTGCKSPFAGIRKINDNICPHCNRYFDIANYVRWHGDNCKLKKI